MDVILSGNCKNSKQFVLKIKNIVFSRCNLFGGEFILKDMFQFYSLHLCEIQM